MTTEADLEFWRDEARSMAARAAVDGVILTIEQRTPPGQPPAMGKFETVVSARRDRTGGHAVAPLASPADSTGAMAAARFGTTGAGAAIERVFPDRSRV